MGPRGMSASLTSVLCLLCGLAVADDPVPPGQSDYWVLFQSLSTSEGAMDPPFTPEGTDFTVEVSNIDIKSLSLTFELNLAKYDPTQVPKITVNDEEYEYSPVDTMTYKIRLDESIAPVDKVYAIKVADPLGPSGWPVPRENAHTYNVRIKQKPDFEKVIEAVDLQVLGENGNEIPADKAFQPTEKKYHYNIPDGQSQLALQMNCSFVATSMTYDGNVVELNSTQIVQLTSALTQVNLQCIYDDPKWTAVVQEKTYALSFERKIEVDENLTVGLMISAEQGYCGPRPIKEKRGMTGFVCRSGVAEPNFIGMINNHALELQLVNEKNGQTSSLPPGMPVAVPIPEKESSAYTLKVLGADIPLEYPVQVIHAAKCDTFECPSTALARSDILNVEAAQSYLCSAEKCTPEDEARCCKELPPCTSIEGIEDVKCPSDMMLSLEETCKHDPCTDQDTAQCCVKGTTTMTTTPKPIKETFAHLGKGHGNWKLNTRSGNFEHVGRREGAYRKETFHYVGHGNGDFEIKKDGTFHHVGGDHGEFLQEDFKYVGEQKGEYEQRHDGAFHHVKDGDYIKLKSEFYFVGKHRGNFIRTAKGHFENVGSNQGTYKKQRGKTQGHKKKNYKLRRHLKYIILHKMEYYRRVGCGPTAARMCLGDMCVYDKGCMQSPPTDGGVGCFAGGIFPACRYCGFGMYPACPAWYDCAGPCHAWTPAHHAWCYENYEVHCPKFLHHVTFWADSPISELLGQGRATTAVVAGIAGVAALTALAAAWRMSGRRAVTGGRQMELLAQEAMPEAPLIE